MDQHAGAQRFFEDAQQVQLVLQKLLVVLHRDAVVDHLKPLADFRAAAEDAFQQRFGLHMGGFEPADEDARQIPHRGGMAEIGLHENLDAPPAPDVLIAHRLGDLHLHVEGQLFRRAPGN